MTEKSVRDQTSLRSPPPKGNEGEETTSCGLEAPCHQQQGAFHMVENEKSSMKAEVPSERDFDTQEALRNFQSYLDILREWDEKEKEKAEGLPVKNGKM